jgi:hypothetical protein
MDGIAEQKITKRNGGDVEILGICKSQNSFSYIIQQLKEIEEDHRRDVKIKL